MFTVHNKYYFANNLLFLSLIQEIDRFQEAVGNFFKTAVEALYFNKIFEELTKAVSSPSSTPQSTVSYW